MTNFYKNKIVAVAGGSGFIGTHIPAAEFATLLVCQQTFRFLYRIFK